ncbi:335_t:CDS:1, partial [Paraglomus brasilianum]
MVSAEVAAARIAYATSKVAYTVERNTKSVSSYTSEITELYQRKKKNVFDEITEFEVLSSKNDPFAKVLSNITKGSPVSIITPAKYLLSAIPHLYKLANGKSAVVIHAVVERNSANDLGDYTHIMAVRQTGCALIASNGGQDSADTALIAHGLAIKSGNPVVHFFDAATSRVSDDKIESFSKEVIAKFVAEAGIDKYRTESNDGQNVELYLRTIESANGQEQPNATDFSELAEQIFTQFKEKTGRLYKRIECSGNKNAETVIVSLGSGVRLLRQALKHQPELKIALFSVRLYRPWSDSKFLAEIPRNTKRVAVVEQVSKRTTKWSPLYLDVISSFENQDLWKHSIPTVINAQYGNLDANTSVNSIENFIGNLSSATASKIVTIGKESSELSTQATNGHSIQSPPALELAYLKMLEEVFGNRLYIANAMTQPTVGHLGEMKSTPEFGFGVLLSRLQRRAEFIDLVSRAVKSTSIPMPEPLHIALTQWIMHKNNANLAKKHGDTSIELLLSLYKKNALLGDIYNRRNQFLKPANWLVGSDDWSYDIGNSGVHHVISSGKNINMLIIDSQPYTSRTAADPEKRKKDIGLYAMNYGNVYVAAVAVYSSYTQVLHALMEAEDFDGPSIVLAYLPYHSENDSSITVLKETKLAVDTGYWPLYRWNPALEAQGKEPFTLDSERIKQELKSFLDRENYLTQLVKSRPELATTLASSLESDVANRQRTLAKSAYDKLLGGLTGPPLVILYGSDNGNAEGIARRLQKGAKARGINARCMAMDDYPIEELSAEKNVAIVTSTAGQGEFPQNAREFWKHISSTTDISLGETSYAVFALGDSHYWPRAEDAIYYNKPGKDLDNRLELLGGQRLLPVGMGDDQDPDGYETGFQAWEPELWKALGVELLGTVVEEPKKSDDDLKIKSNYLRGTILEGLEDTSTGALAEQDTKLTKFHGIYQQDDRDLRDERKAQGLEKAFMFMVRVRVPGGVSTSEQWLAMDEIADKHANGTLKITTRQAYQLHGVIKRNLRNTIRDINKCLLDTLAACGDVNRNVMCNPNPHLSQLHADINDFAHKISAHLTPRTSAYHEIWLDDKVVAGNAVQDYEPLYGSTYLPRKFKIAIAVPPSNDVDVFAHDLGYIAIADKNGKLAGYTVTVGGGMGMTHNNKKTYPRLAEPLCFCTPEQAIDVGEKVMLVQRDFGDRINRKHARLKYTIDDHSLEWFREEVENKLGYKLQPPREFTFDSNADRYGWTKGANDNWNFCMYIENGRVKDEPGALFKTGLREIAKVHKGDFRLTPNQHLVLGNISPVAKPQIEGLLKEYKLDNLQYTGVRLNSMSCVALPTCGLAMAEAERYLPTLVEKIESIVEDVGLGKDAITIRMTGCPNGCARPYVAEIAFVGKAPGTYNVYLGGGHHGQRLNKLYKESLKESEILKELKPILTRYVKEREDGEKFGDFVIRI